MEKGYNELQDDSNYLTFKDIVLMIQDYWKEVKKSSKWILILIGVFLCYFLGNAILTKPKFEAEVTFMVNEDELGGGAIGGLLGQFSGLLGSGEELNFQKILEIGRTRKIAEKVFFRSVEMNGKSNLLANHFIDQLEQDGVWGKTPFYTKNKNPLLGFRFQHTKVDSFTRFENMVFKQLHQMLLSVMSTTFKDKTAIMKLSVTTNSEPLSYELCMHIFKEMSDFYIDKSVEKQSATFLALQHKADSLKALMSRNEYGLANIKDTYRSTWLNTQDVPKTILDRDNKMTAMVYGEVVKNLELASFSLQNRTPYIQSIDEPILPLLVIKPKIISEIFKSIALGLLIGISAVVARSFYKKQMS